MLKLTKNVLTQTRKPLFLAFPRTSGTAQQSTNSRGERTEEADSLDGGASSQGKTASITDFHEYIRSAVEHTAKFKPEVARKSRPRPTSSRSHTRVPTPSDYPTTPPPRKALDAKFCAQIVHQIAKNPDDIIPVIDEIEKLKSLDHRARAYEVASDELLRQKRPRTHKLLLDRMATEGISMSKPMHAKVVVPSLKEQQRKAMDPSRKDTDPPRIPMLIHDIISDSRYTELQFAELLRMMQIYNVDRGLVTKYVNHFRQLRESQGPYEPLPALIPAIVEGLARDKEVDRALTTLENLIPEKSGDIWALKRVENAYIRILHVLCETHEWDLDIVERVKRGVVRHGVNPQNTNRLLLSWAARREIYASVASIHGVQVQHRPGA
ncbi:hypothetical protein HYPSUDRAFT_207318 [Hypholoma sublateritium FD-334 SS-4]|uniref:Uncharacterized protein n=1 Tax=Hypholoma sublateritium (strain FD-334 SS-4) TaxID=945553 RepID=A0A0D2LYW6_HYPSF|nr:hypothetical protein HYPSUDRAFT_207318 [Hypholoma sublateritium FD-334 SS-4]